MRSGGKFALTVVGLSVVMFGSCVGQQLFDLNGYNGLYGEPMYENSVRRPRSILQNFAVDRMLKDNGFVRSIINCVLDKGPCESNGRKLRLMAPEILRGQCPGCSRTVHNQIRRVISHVQRNFPVEWSEVTRRFMGYNNPGGQDFGPHGALPPSHGGFPPSHGGFAPPQGGFAPPQGGFAPPQGSFSPPQGVLQPSHGAAPQIHVDYASSHEVLSAPHGALSPPHPQQQQQQQQQQQPQQVAQPPNLPTSYDPNPNNVYQQDVYG